MTNRAIVNTAKLMVTRREAASLVSLSVRAIDKELHLGNLGAQKYGTKVLIPTDELRRWVASLPAYEG